MPGLFSWSSWAEPAHLTHLLRQTPTYGAKDQPVAPSTQALSQVGAGGLVFGLPVAFGLAAVPYAHLRVEPGWDRRRSAQRLPSRTIRSLARSNERANQSLQLPGRPPRDRRHLPDVQCLCRRTGVAGPQLSSTVRRLTAPGLAHNAYVVSLT